MGRCSFIAYAWNESCCAVTNCEFYSGSNKYKNYPPTPLPGLRGRRKGSTKHRFGVPVTVLDLCIDVFAYWGFCLVFSGGCYVACRGSVAPDFGLLCAGAGALFLFLGASKGAVLDQARLRHVLDLCSYVFTSWGFFLFFFGGFYVLGLFSCSEGVPKVPF